MAFSEAIGSDESKIDIVMTMERNCLLQSVIQQEVFFPVSIQRVYSALTNDEQFSEVTNAPAEIGGEAGAPFSCFDGKIIGRQVELIPNKRIVQIWRSASWEAGIYSIVRFDLDSTEEGVRLTLEQTGVPGAQVEDLSDGWRKMYWDQLHAFFVNM